MVGADANLTWRHTHRREACSRSATDSQHGEDHVRPPPLPDTALGAYRHYKGREYEVIGVARHSETHEPLVVYRPLYMLTPAEN
jgi:hypothetical protein